MSEPQESAKPHVPPWRGRAIARLRNYFVTGIIVVGPIAITIYLARWLIDWVDSTFLPLVPKALIPDTYLPFAVPGFGLLVAFLGLTVLGAFTANIVGRTMFSYGEQVVERMPLVRSVYRMLKQLFETVLSERESNFKQAALIEWPRPGLWSIVFVTGDARGEVRRRLPDGEEMVSVFIPTTPNPTGGYLMFARRRDLRLLDMSVEDAVKLVISGGLVMPEERVADLPVTADAPPRAAAE